MSDEKRKSERKSYFSEVSLEFSSGNYQARISDLSEGGCFVDSIATVTEGDFINITIRRPGGDAWRFESIIAYTMPGFGFGVRFKNLTDEHISFLQQILSQAGSDTEGT